MIGPFNRYYRYDTDGYSDSGFYPYLSSYRVVKATEQGAWINVYDKLKLVLNGEGKRFAHATKGAALKSYIARKRRQLDILSYQLERETDCKALAEEMLKQGEFDARKLKTEQPFWMVAK